MNLSYFYLNLLIHSIFFSICCVFVQLDSSCLLRGSKSGAPGVGLLFEHVKFCADPVSIHLNNLEIITFRNLTPHRDYLMKIKLALLSQINPF